MSRPARSSSLAAATLVALAGAALVAVTPAFAASAPTAPGTYVPLSAQTRVLDTRTGAQGNHKGAVGAGASITPQITGKGSVPRTGVGSVVLTLSALSPTGNGGLRVWGATAPGSVTNLQFAKGDRAVSDTVVVPLTSAGRITVRNDATSGTTQIAADVVGYYVAGSASTTDPGVFHPLSTAARVVDTRTGAQGNHKGALSAGAAINPTLGGKVGIPSSAGAVAATITVYSPTKGGSIAAWRQNDAASTLAAVHFGAGQRVSGFVVLGVGDTRSVLRNNSAGSVQVSVDVTGYYTQGVSQSAGTLRPVEGAQVSSTTARPNTTLSIPLGGKGGVPLRNVTAVAVTLHVRSGTAVGSVQAWQGGAARPGLPVAFYFSAGRTTSNTLLLPVSSSGALSVFVAAGANTALTVDVHGYVPSTTVVPPAAFVGRYPNDLTGDAAHDAALMDADGCLDAKAGSLFVLIQVGAQSITTPGLSSAAPGVVLTQTRDRRPIAYSALVPTLNAYVAAYARCAPGARPTIAFGTNTDGAWDPSDVTSYYSPARRGADWADQVINPVQSAAPAGITVLGANDIEADFGGASQDQAIAWENAYLAAVANSAKLVDNGSLDGCSAVFGSTSSCNQGWTQAKYVTLATNQGRVLLLPQVYVRNQAVQFANLDAASGGRITYAGVLTESVDPGTFSAPQGWVALNRALSSVRSVPPALPVSVDIRKDS